MIDLLNHIKNLSIEDKKTLSQKGLKLSEEAGELAKAILPYEGADGCNHRFPNVDKIIEESIDTILVAYSIAHSIIEKYEVGDSDDIIMKMLQKKTNKWQSLVDGEKTDLNKMPFEIHVTLAQTDNIEKFKTDCVAIGVKPIILDLYTGDGGVIKDVMTSSKVVGNSLDAAIETRRISASFKAYGYTVLREKIETAPWHPASINAPFNPSSAKYYETHFAFSPKSDIKEFCAVHNIKLSKNTMKKDDSAVQMGTYRKSSEIITPDLFKSEVDQLLSLAESHGIEILEYPVIEYALYDTNVSHDKAAGY